MAPWSSRDGELKRVQEQIQQLTTEVQALAFKLDSYINFHRPQEKPDEENCQIHGRRSGQELLDWMVTIREMVAMRFRTWWSQLVTLRTRFDNKPKISSWDQLKKKMSETFLPPNYDPETPQDLHMLLEEFYKESLSTRVDDMNESDQQHQHEGLWQKFRHQLNLNPFTSLAEAHRQARIAEAKKKMEFIINVFGFFFVWWCAVTLATVILLYCFGLLF